MKLHHLVTFPNSKGETVMVHIFEIELIDKTLEWESDKK